MRTSGGAAALALALLSTLAAAAPLPLSAHLEVRGDTILHGSADGTLAWGGSAKDARLGADGAGEAFDVVGDAELRTYTFVEVVRDQGSPLGYDRRLVPVGSDVAPLGPVHGRVTFSAPGPHLGLRVLPAPGTVVPAPANLTLTPPQDFARLLEAGDATEQAVGTSDLYPRPGGRLTGVALPAAGAAFDGRLAATDVVAHLPGRDVDTAWAVERSEVPGVGATSRWQSRVLVVSGSVAPAQALDGAGWAHSVERLDARLDGDLLLANAQGTGSLNGTPLPSGFHLFQAMGSFQAAADYTGTDGSWQVDGAPRFLALDARAVLPAAALATSAVGLGILAGLLAFASGRLPELAGLLVGRVRRLAKADAFASPTRRRVLQTLHEHQPAALPDLQRRTGLSRTALSYHLRVLVAYDLVQTRLPVDSSRRNRVFMINSNSLAFDLPPQPQADAPVAADVALAAVNSHGERRWIFDAVHQNGPLDYRRLAALRAEAGRPPLPQSSASYHLSMLVKARALDEAWRDGRKEYSAAIDAAAAQLEQYRRLLRQAGALDAVRRLSRSEPAADDRAVDRLVKLGLAERKGASVALHPFLGGLAARL